MFPAVRGRVYTQSVTGFRKVVRIASNHRNKPRCTCLGCSCRCSISRIVLLSCFSSGAACTHWESSPGHKHGRLVGVRVWPNGVFFPGRVGSGVRSGSRVSVRSRIHPVGDRFPKSGPNRLEPQKQAKGHLSGLFLQVFCFPHRPGKGPQSGCTNWGAWESERGRHTQAVGVLAPVVLKSDAIFGFSGWLLGLVA